MSQQLTVRPVAPTDLAQWEALWEGYNTFYERAVPPEITRVTWSRFFDANEPFMRWSRRKKAGFSGWCTISFTEAPH